MSKENAQEFCIRSNRVLLSSSDTLSPKTLHVKNGRIETVFTGTTPLPSCPLIDMGNFVISAGIVDTHAHLNEPGRTEWEGFETATRAASAGGITTIVDMPLNSIPVTTTIAALATKRESVSKHASIDYGFWGGVIPGNLKELSPMVDSGILGFKAFMIDSGIAEFPFSDEKTLRESMKVLAQKNVPLLVHAELESPVKTPEENKTYLGYLESRPDKWEEDAIELIIRLMRETGCRTHIVHLSSAKALPAIIAAKKEGLPLTVETCPHYLSFISEEIPDGATHYKCAPPIRNRENKEALWKALVEGHIDMIVSDHSPCTPSLKKMETGNFSEAWGGIAGLQFSFSVVWSEMRKRKLTLNQLNYWMSHQTAKLVGLEKQKGQLNIGHDADLIVWDPDSSFVLSAEKVYHRHTLTPYLGQTLFGKVEKTFLRGHCIYDSGRFNSNQGKEVRKSK